MDKQLFLDQLIALVSDEPNVIANLANISAFLNESFDNINWIGFYLVEDNDLVLGPFQGKPACVRIPIGKGVCGVAAYRRRVVRVGDVFQFAGHIACDAASRSEIVLPIIIKDELIGVLDIDSPQFNRFQESDEALLRKVVKVIQEMVYNYFED
ncbi:MAG: GAF domain-containing protein [Coprobacillus sp.]